MNKRSDESTGERRGVPVMYTRTLMLRPMNQSSYVSEYCRAFDVSYLVLKIGRNVQIGGSNTLIHGAMVLEVPGPGSYKIADRERLIFVVISESGVEAAVDRWPGLEFEHVEAQVSFGYVAINGMKTMIEVKRGVGQGLVAPYTVTMANNDVADLPGFEPLVRTGAVRELRENMRKSKETRDSIIARAVQSDVLDVGEARMHGMRINGLEQVAERRDRRNKNEFAEEEPLTCIAPKPQRAVFQSKKKKDSWADQVEEANRVPVEIKEQIVMPSTPAYIDLMKQVEQGDYLGKDEYFGTPGTEIVIDSIIDEIEFPAQDNMPLFSIDKNSMCAKLTHIGVSAEAVIVRSGSVLYLLTQAPE